jgi:serine/threonine protein kinase
VSEQPSKVPENEDQDRPTVPDFDLIRPIGRGGFGQVWLAKNRATGHLRAVKVIPVHTPGRADPAGREIVSLTRLETNVGRHHPNLLTIHHVGKTTDHLFYVMDLADDASRSAADPGSPYRPATLESRLAGGPLPADQCVQRARQLLTGLAFLHEAGVVHRDVKPSNCLFVDGELKLADFGLLTEVGPQMSRVGTQKYMPPDGHMDARADVYAAGLVVYEMVTGLPVDSFPRLGDRATKIVRSPDLCALTRLALAACHPEPDARFPDARAMLAQLEAGPRKSPRWKRLWRRVILAGGIAALAAAGTFWLAQAEHVHVNFITEAPYFESEIYLNGQRQLQLDGTPYKTPCTIDDLPSRVYHVVLKREGLPDRDLGPIDFRETRQIVVGSGSAGPPRP